MRRALSLVTLLLLAGASREAHAADAPASEQAVADQRALLEGDLWLRNASHSNAMAQRLRRGVEAGLADGSIRGVTFTQPTQANGVFATLPDGVADRLRAIEETLVDVVTQAILHTPERAPLAPYCGEQRIVETIRTAVAFRGEPQRARLARYLARLAPGTAWYATVRALTTGPANQRPR